MSNKGKSINSNELHPMWKGNDASVKSKHCWINRHFGKANRCEGVNCKKISNHFEWANISEKYTRNREDYLMLCRSCHLQLDRRKKCLKGHLRTKENTYIYANGHRRCRTCANIAQNKKRRRNGRYKGVRICSSNKAKSLG